MKTPPELQMDRARVARALATPKRKRNSSPTPVGLSKNIPFAMEAATRKALAQALERNSDADHSCALCLLFLHLYY